MARILIVDDNAVNRELLVTLLGYQKHQLFEASDGLEALGVVRAEKPDLVITDILMPTMDGYEFVRQLRADVAIAATAVIFYTAHYHKKEAQALAKSCGVAHILIKPCEPEVILRAVADSLGNPLQIMVPVAPTDFSQEHLRVITDKLSRTTDELVAANQHLSALVDIGLQLASEREPRQLINNVCRAARDLFGAKYAVLAVGSRDEGRDVYFVTSGMDTAIVDRFDRPVLRNGVVGNAFTERKSRRISHVKSLPATGLPAQHPPVKSLLVAPVVSLAHCYGWICLTDKVGAEGFNAEDEQLLTILAAQIGRIYENGSLYHEMEDYAARLDAEVTQRKQTLETLAESEQRFRQMAENIGEVFWLTDPSKNQLLYVSPAYERIWGRSCEALYKSPGDWMEAIHPDDRERVRHAAQKQAFGEYVEEYRIVRPDGSIRWISDRGFPVARDSGVYRIAGLAEDITERKRNADELRESERRFSGMLANVELISVMLDGKARITYCNDYFLRLTGWQRQEVIGQCFFEFFIPPELIDELNGVYKTLLADLSDAWHYENEILTRSGGRRLIRWNNSVLRSAAGETIGTASIGEDITDQKLAEEKIRRLNRVYAVLSGINALIVRVKDRQQLFDAACSIAVEHGNFGIVWIGLLDAVTLDVTPVAWAGHNEGPDSSSASAKGSARDDAPHGRGTVGRAIRAKKAVFCNDLLAESIAGPRRIQAIQKNYRSVISLPLIVEGDVIGVMVLFAKELNFFNDDELTLLNELAGDISFALAHIDQEAKLAKLSRIRALSSGVNAAIVRINEREALLKEACRIATDVGKFGLVWVALLDPEQEKIQPIAWSGFSVATAQGVTWSSVGKTAGTLAEIIETRRPAVRNDLTSALSQGKLREEAVNRGYFSTICLPLLTDGAVVAVMNLFAAGRDFFDSDEYALLTEAAADISFALDHIAKAEKLNYLAYYDDLTGLPNRTLLEDYLGRVMRRANDEGSKTALVMCDINRFSHVNETLGRQSGDALLRQFAQRLKHLWPERDNIGRLSGNQFGGIVANFKDAAEIAHLIEDPIAKALNEPFKLANENLRVSATIGIAVFPGDGDSTDTLFKNAEAALKQAKLGGDKYLFYHAKMNAAVTETLRLENNLRRAIDRHEFVLHYQPKVDLTNGKISGLEALIRWNDPESGLIPPMRFIPLLEETGMILDVGIWAIGQALHAYREWYTQGLQPPRVAVNVSSIQLRKKNFVELVAKAIKDSKAMPHGLDLEITESLIMDDIEGNIKKLKALRDMGINIAIDDFGTGYSSLRYLARLPVDLLKIDRSFITGMTNDADSMALVSTIISLAHSLNMKVIAEGVEFDEQSRLLKLLKCDEMQGYLFSKPLPMEQLTKMLHEQRGT